MFKYLIGVFAFAAHVFVLPGQTIAKSEWPTLHKDYQRSGYTDEVIRGPYERKWYRDFHDEMIATRVEAIVAEGKCFVGTFAGNMYALNVLNSEVIWKFKAAGPIGASPCYEKGRLYFGADEGFATGHLYCIDAIDGTLIWRYNAEAGIWVSPACDGRRVYFGDRAGIFHAISAETGELLWTLETGGMILKPASFSPSGNKIVFGSEDMHVYCVDPEGKLLWKSDKLEGLLMRNQGPTIWQGLRRLICGSRSAANRLSYSPWIPYRSILPGTMIDTCRPYLRCRQTDRRASESTCYLRGKSRLKSIMRTARPAGNCTRFSQSREQLKEVTCSSVMSIGVPITGVIRDQGIIYESTRANCYKLNVVLAESLCIGCRLQP
ncbi:MAG: PQQ-binding-like beta-propeller repeat protein [Phycisphaerae bacterium]|nr:PQQ-binding-like beta-propeller repeat protein [Phycisphaerae bacterium]